MTLFLQRLFDGLANGAIYASLAVALTVVYRSSGILNLAQGEMAMFSTYLMLLVTSPTNPAVVGSELVSLLGAPYPIWLGMAVAVAVSVPLGAAVERAIVRPVAHDQVLSVVSVTLALFLFIQSGAGKLWAGKLRFARSAFPDGPQDRFVVAGARLRYSSLGLVATLIVVLAVLTVLMRVTKLGLAFRAVSSNRASSELCGIEVGRVLSVGWGVAAGLGGLAAMLVAPTVTFGPSMMMRLLIFSLAAATLGGLDSPTGAVVGGLTFGLLETMLAGYVSFVASDLTLVWALAVLIVVLVVRPTGLFGRRTPERV